MALATISVTSSETVCSRSASSPCEAIACRARRADSGAGDSVRVSVGDAAATGTALQVPGTTSVHARSGAGRTRGDIPSGMRVPSSMRVAEHTFIFPDLVGFTTLTAERGDDHGADVALSFYARVRALLGDHRAEEVKTIGDAMMLRCEDPAAAVALGLQIVRAMDAPPPLPP